MFLNLIIAAYMLRTAAVVLAELRKFHHFFYPRWFITERFYTLVNGI